MTAISLSMADQSTPKNGTVENGVPLEDSDQAKVLEKWKTKVEKADDEKSRLVLEKLAMDDSKKEAQKEMEGLLLQEQQYQAEVNNALRAIEHDIVRLENGNRDLMDQLRKCRDEIKVKRDQFFELQQRFKITAPLPDKKAKFIGKAVEEQGEDNNHIKAVFTISQRPSLYLKGGQAFITFEEEKVATQILKLAKCSVPCDQTVISVKPKSLTLHPSVKFEVHVSVSKKTLRFSNAPPSMTEERMKDRLEMSFSRPSRGGGEVEGVEYDKTNGTGQITFLDTGVVENLTLKRKYLVDLDREVDLDVDLVYDYQLRKFQTFCGAPKRTILLDDIEGTGDEEDLQDHLEIYFQKPCNYGGEVESIKYISAGKKLKAFFTEDSANSD